MIPQLLGKWRGWCVNPHNGAVGLLSEFLAGARFLSFQTGGIPGYVVRAAAVLASKPCSTVPEPENYRPKTAAPVLLLYVRKARSSPRVRILVT